MKRYKLSTGLSQVREEPFFKTDKEAWEYLRKKYSTSKYATLYREEIVEVPIVNRKQYVKLYNENYRLQKKGKTNTQSYWMPVLDGITSHSYRAVK